MNFLNPKKVISQATVGLDSVVVDFGFGKGDFLKFLAKEVGKNGKVYAIDIQEDIVRRVEKDFLEEEILNVSFLVGDLEEKKSTKLGDKTVDFILISSLLFQSKNKEKILQEANRILKNKGRILFID